MKLLYSFRYLKTVLNVVFVMVSLPNVVNGQTRCDSLPDTAQIFVIVEEMPESNLNDQQLVDLLNNQIDLKQYSLNPFSTVYFSVTVNCRGEAFNFEILRPLDPGLDFRIIDVLEAALSWNPGTQRGKPVDVRLTRSIHIVDNQFKILTEKELKKLHKIKKKK